ncbi:General stress protein A, partial [Haemophilus influenzae]
VRLILTAFFLLEGKLH